MRKSRIITIIILIVVLLVVRLFVYFRHYKMPINQITTNEIKELNPEVLGNKDDLISFSIIPGSKVSSGEQKVTGIVKGGYFFEGNIILRLLDSDKKVLTETHGTAITDWMVAGPVSFEGTMDFTFLPGNYYIEIHNDNPSGLLENDKSILIPIVRE